MFVKKENMLTLSEHECIFFSSKPGHVVFWSWNLYVQYIYINCNKESIPLCMWDTNIWLEACFTVIIFGGTCILYQNYSKGGGWQQDSQSHQFCPLLVCIAHCPVFVLGLFAFICITHVWMGTRKCCKGNYPTQCSCGHGKPRKVKEFEKSISRPGEVIEN